MTFTTVSSLTLHSIIYIRSNKAFFGSLKAWLVKVHIGKMWFYLVISLDLLLRFMLFQLLRYCTSHLKFYIITLVIHSKSRHSRHTIIPNLHNIKTLHTLFPLMQSLHATLIWIHFGMFSVQSLKTVGVHWLCIDIPPWDTNAAVSQLCHSCEHAVRRRCSTAWSGFKSLLHGENESVGRGPKLTV